MALVKIISNWITKCVSRSEMERHLLFNGIFKLYHLLLMKIWIQLDGGEVFIPGHNVKKRNKLRRRG